MSDFNERPCIRRVGKNLCGHPENAPIHEPAEGCTADGGRCDYPFMHHNYESGAEDANV